MSFADGFIISREIKFTYENLSLFMKTLWRYKNKFDLMNKIHYYVKKILGGMLCVLS